MSNSVDVQGNMADFFNKHPELMQKSIVINGALLEYDDVDTLNSNGIYISGLVRRKNYSEFNHDGFGYIKKEVYENPMNALSQMARVCEVAVIWNGDISLNFE